MKHINEKLQLLKAKIGSEKIRIMIIGLGSVGSYLLDYLVSMKRPQIEIVVVGRNSAKIETDVNIIKISALIRKANQSNIIIDGTVDLDQIETIAAALEKYRPDIIVNTSRVYAGLKYGSISWNTIRAYGIWAPLAIKYIRNIMMAYDQTASASIVINTSYSDAVIPWLKSAGCTYPDFGSGNINHLIPRIQYAAADLLNVEDFWNIDVMFATSHFHDVVISKEGHTEGMTQLIKVYYKQRELPLDQKRLFEKCKIPMPVDAKRNMMNASSNYNMIQSILNAAEKSMETHFFSPGALGEIGGYPVKITTENGLEASINQTVFSLDEMREYNRKSIYYDGIETIAHGKLVYTDELLEKVKTKFNVALPKAVCFSEIDCVAEFLIEGIIKFNS